MILDFSKMYSKNVLSSFFSFLSILENYEGNKDL